ncbi:hypothetical protein BD413DRAFT_582216 [Trametes elegans]|nr:hypothetical protein BD413DRAFT_582216 [Trametes elegans]
MRLPWLGYQSSKFSSAIGTHIIVPKTRLFLFVTVSEDIGMLFAVYQHIQHDAGTLKSGSFSREAQTRPPATHNHLARRSVHCGRRLWERVLSSKTSLPALAGPFPASSLR